MTDPDAGTIQGIQRYGKTLPTNPEPGTGYPYFVFPSVREPGLPAPFSGAPTLRLTPFEQERLRLEYNQIQQEFDRVQQSYRDLKNNQAAMIVPQAQGGASGAIVSSAMQQATAFDTASLLPLSTPSSPVFAPGLGDTSVPANIPHQPLIQIKIRVVEVVRNDSLAVASTLDYIRNRPGLASEFMGADPLSPNINQDGRNLTGVSRFNSSTTSGLINLPNSAMNLSNMGPVPAGAGALVNLTSEHLNWVASLLATELEADVITAPELVTTNGEGVEFVAGSKQAFTLGTVRSTTTDNMQNYYFYKHVGTYLRVTPRIVNYTAFGIGRGDAAIVDSEILNWNTLIQFLLDEGFVYTAYVPPPTQPGEGAKKEEEKKKTAAEQPTKDPKAVLAETWRPYARQGGLVPLEIKQQVLEIVNQYSRTELRNYICQRMETDETFNIDFFHMIEGCDGDRCRWRPEDCTIDLEVLARFSTTTDGTPPGDISMEDADFLAVANAENDVRAIGNVLQIKNGTGLVMAGLLAESDVEAESKVPVLGDLPLVGAMFRAKSVTRAKTEILIFIEARVLSDDASLARAESAADLHLAAPYVAAGTLDNPLEIGLYRAGFDAYLPPPTLDEQQYWQRFGRRGNRSRAGSRILRRDQVAAA
ncbi:MAG: hypothetical protein KY475_16990, partial [Planctomycetes bacterium]|nr:hypothetical protein [Planctomycetota bacterium]